MIIACDNSSLSCLLPIKMALSFTLNIFPLIAVVSPETVSEPFPIAMSCVMSVFPSTVRASEPATSYVMFTILFVIVDCCTNKGE